MSSLVNLGLISQPWNWLVIFLMVAFAIALVTWLENEGVA